MIRRAFRRGLAAGVLAALAAAVVRAVRGRGGGVRAPLPVAPPWAPLPAVAPPAPPVDLSVVAAPRAADVGPGGSGVGWLAPEERSCPASHPVKVRLASGIFHLPGMLDYERTRPDRCYVDATAAENDGFRIARR